jgi:hypothetical protein
VVEQFVVEAAFEHGVTLARICLSIQVGSGLLIAAVIAFLNVFKQRTFLSRLSFQAAQQPQGLLAVFA